MRKHYNWIAPFSLKKLILSRDIYFALGLFLMAQVFAANISSKISIVIPIGLGLMTLLFAYLSIRKQNENNWKNVRMGTIAFSLGIIIILIFAMSPVFRLMGYISHEQPNQIGLNQIINNTKLLGIFMIAIVAPITEEIIFRELIPNALGKSIIAFAVSSTLFVAIHFPSGIIGWFSYLSVATGLTYARIRDDSIYSGICVHIIWNTMTLLMIFL